MLGRIVSVALRQRLLVILAALGLAAWGWTSYRSLPIDAFPDVSPTQVLVSLRANGLTPEELEERVTVPVELAMTGTPNLASMRSTTRYSVALLTFEFADGTDIFWARAQVNERLNGVMGELPDGTEGGLAPIVTPLAEMLLFTLDAPGLTLDRQRTLVDWTIRPILRSVAGVADVNVMGGHVRTYAVVPSSVAMAARGITMSMLRDALTDNNRNDGAGRVRDGEEALLVRAEGRIRSLDELRTIVVAARPNGVVLVSDVAEVRYDTMARNGVVTRDGQGEAVWATVLGLRGADARLVVDGVKARLPEIEAALPEGVKLNIFYDRAELIGAAVWTVQKVLLEAVALVVVLLLLFLGNLRAAIVVSAILPLAVLGTFGVMKWQGLTANIMSLGGLAIAIGLLVDCAVVVVENAAHRLALAGEKADARQRRGIVLEATREVAVPLVSGVVIIATMFFPLLSLQGLEGRLFGPVALAIVFAICTALLLSITVVPVLCAMLLKTGNHKEPWLVRQLHKVYDPLVAFALRRPLPVVAVALAGLVAAGFVYPRIGSTFMPTMDEGTPVVSIRKHPTIRVEEAAETDLRIQRALMAEVPEVRGVVARAGADELGIDPVGLNETDFYLQFRPRDEWRPDSRGASEWVMERVREVLDRFPGISFAFAQPIDMRVQEMIIGARGDVVVKIFGNNIGELNRVATEVAGAIRGVAGATDVFALRNEGMKYLTVRVDRLAAGRVGLNVRDVQEALRVWVDGHQLGIVVEAEGPRVPLMLRGSEVLRRSGIDLSRVTVVLPGGGTLPLSAVAAISEDEGPVQVVREGSARFATVLANVQGSDLVSFVAEAQAAAGTAVRLPPGYRLQWGGQFENQQRASARLAVVVPMALGVIFLLLYLTFGSIRQAILVFCNVPFAAIGGIVALWASGEFLSVPASVGFIALIGIAVLNGVVLISAINRLIAEEGLTLREGVLEGAKRRMTPVILTATIAAFGLVPFLFADGPGAEIQRPLAIVVIGGLVTATLLTLVLLPILYDRFALPKEKRPTDAAEEPRAVIVPVPGKAGAAGLPSAAE